ncbi:hypothetical protein BJ875DRAFT_507139 [Amylocarpus encephaloides]|uniref:BZIP domain-containing protein n=1 Tax=Amylocarpus encephaloides TaxID=45428 RepID=A0A9P7YBM8_9HELO|nr:hypothetical protein BJ875DRAFT_507139 [Amylocarpus encephaloides]
MNPPRLEEFLELPPRFRPPLSTATIPSQESQLFTTDPPSRWLPSSSPSLPAQHLPARPPQSLPSQDQDFVLFENPAARRTPSLSNNSAITGRNRRHSAHLASVQNQRVAAIIQSTGHSISTSNLTNRFSSPAQNNNHFYASSAPASSAQLQQQRPTRPPVPLFAQSTGNIPQTPNMDSRGTYELFTALQTNSCDSHKPDMDLFDENDFTAFEGGASTSNHFIGSAFNSPAVTSIYDLPQMNVSSSSTNMGTVSPQDLHRDPFGSAPPSTAFTNLTSPSTYNESPEFTDSFDASPFVVSNDHDQCITGDPWYPLFPQEDHPEPLKVSESPLLPEEEVQVSEHLRANGRKRSSNGASPVNNTHSSVAGINARKGGKPLGPIVVDDPNDAEALKRARNTLAARKSRQRKMQKMEDLEDQIAKLEAERDHWKDIALRRTG